MNVLLEYETSQYSYEKSQVRPAFLWSREYLKLLDKIKINGPEKLFHNEFNVGPLYSITTS